MKKHMDDTEEKEEGRRAFGKLFHRENEEKPWDNEPIDDVEEEDWPLVEYEDLEIEEDGSSEHNRGAALRFVIVGIVVLALLAAGFFLIRHFTGNRGDKEDSTTVVVTSDMVSDMDEADEMLEDEGMMLEDEGMMEEDDMMLEDEGMMEEDDMMLEDEGMMEEDSMLEEDLMMSDSEDGMDEETIPLPAVNTTPPTVTDIVETPASEEPIATTVESSSPAEKFDLSDIDTSDLSAVRAYIQSQLDAIAADLYCPNIDEITMNEDCTVFTAVCNSIDESLAEQEAVAKIYDLGKLYATYAGTTPGKIRIEYKNHVGDMLWVRESAS